MKKIYLLFLIVFLFSCTITKNDNHGNKFQYILENEMSIDKFLFENPEYKMYIDNKERIVGKPTYSRMPFVLKILYNNKEIKKILVEQNRRGFVFEGWYVDRNFYFNKIKYVEKEPKPKTVKTKVANTDWSIKKIFFLIILCFIGLQLATKLTTKVILVQVKKWKKTWDEV